MDIALAVLEPSDAELIPFASRIAARTNARLGVLVVHEGPATRIRRFKESDKPDNPHAEDHDTAVFRAVRNATAALDNRDTTIYACRGPRPHATLAAAINAAAADRLLIALPVEETSGRQALVRRLSRTLPAHLLVVRSNGPIPKAPGRIVIPQLDGGGRHAIAATVPALADAGIPIIAIPDPAHAPRSKRTLEQAKAKLAPGHRSNLEKIDTSYASLTNAVAETLRDNDALVIEIAHPKRLAAATTLADKALTPRDDSTPVRSITTIIVRPEESAGDTLVGRQVRRVRAHLPVLERDDRVALTNRLEAGGRLSTDFAIMLALSAAIASLGLIQGSTAVVVGAMLVAPLMTPLVAAGMAIVQGNARVFRQSLGAMGGGILGALALAIAVGLISPWQDLSAEVIARTSPNLFDLAIAGLSGFAAAYALARPGLVGTLAGVSIAVALVPPLGAVGIATAKAEFALAFGALVLFATNLVAIILGASATFRFFGLQAAASDAAVPLWVRFASVALITGGLIISIPLVDNQLSQADDGVNRPLLLPLGPSLRAAINERVAQHNGIEVLQMSKGGIEQDNRITVILACSVPAPNALIIDIESIIRAERGQSVDVMVIPVTVADVSPEPASP